MSELEKFINELQRHADNGATEIHPYISREGENWESTMWIIESVSEGFENIIEIGMKEV
jgi:hypothetical protein